MLELRNSSWCPQRPLSAPFARIRAFLSGHLLPCVYYVIAELLDLIHDSALKRPVSFLGIGSPTLGRFLRQAQALVLETRTPVVTSTPSKFSCV